MSRYQNIPTHIISGFLGAGKTTAIHNLLKQKPEHEQWAVIVNEFGQIGIDAELLNDTGAVIKDIPGGCLCCVGSQALSVGLNQIIKSHQPDRILIEPTGLGHPAKLIATLCGEFYQSVLDLKAIVTLLDARQLVDPRYTEHETFVDQLQVADVLVANKLDCYSEADKQCFYDFAASFNPPKQKLMMVEQARLDYSILGLERNPHRKAVYENSHQHSVHQGEVCKLDERSGWVRVDGQAGDYQSVGWRMSRQFIFNQQMLIQWLERLANELPLDRVKGVVYTDHGCLSINISGQESRLETLPEGDCTSDVSKLELIAHNTVFPVTLDQQLRTLLQD